MNKVWKPKSLNFSPLCFYKHLIFNPTNSELTLKKLISDTDELLNGWDAHIERFPFESKYPGQVLSLPSLLDFLKRANVELKNLEEDLSFPQSGSNKIKTSLSVSQLACFFRILVEEEIIEVDRGKKESFFRKTAETFSTTEAHNISSDSFKNKYLTPEDGTLDFWIKKLKSMHSTVTNIKLGKEKDNKNNQRK